MNHRRDTHPEKRRRCRNDLQGDCAFSDEGPYGCWWRHAKGHATTINDDQDFVETGNVSEQMFKTKPEMMLHKKSRHIDTVSICKEFLKGQCDYLAQRCWFRHDKGSHERSPNVAHNANEHEQEKTTQRNTEMDFPLLQKSKRPPIAEEWKNTPINTLMEEFINLMIQFITNC